MSEFIFPFKFEDILEDSSDNRFSVTSRDPIENADERRIEKKLEEIERDLHTSWSQIKESSNFDFLFYFIRTLEPGKEVFSQRLEQFVPEILCQTLEKLLRDINNESNREVRDTRSIDNMRNSLKMLIFLIIYFLNNTCIKKAKGSLKDELNEMSNLKEKKGKSRKGRKDISKDHQYMIVDKQAQALGMLRKITKLNFRFVWQNKPVDDELFKHFLETSLKMLESKQLLKDTKSAKEDIFAILEFTLSGHDSSLKNTEVKLVNLIYEEETLVDPIADFIVKASKSTSNAISKLSTDFLAILINYVLEKTNINAESQAVKNTKELLSKISTQVPKLFYVNLSTFIGLYDSEAYLLRNALTDIIAEIIKKVLTVKESEDDDFDSKDAKLKAKTKMLDRLVKRVTDKHAYSRMHIMKVFIDLCSSNVVPKEYLQVLLRSACDRIKDVSANVRKKAIELLNEVVKIYFSIYVENKERGFLPKDDLERQKKYVQNNLNDLEKNIMEIKEKMKRYMEESDEVNELNDELKIQMSKWTNLDGTKKYIEEYINLLIQLERVIPNLVQLLGSKNSGDVTETIRVLINLKVYKFPYADIGIRKMLVLIWSKERNIIEELLNAYWQLYFDADTYSPERVAGNLIHLYNRSNLTERTSLEEVLSFVLDEKSDDEKEAKLKEAFNFPDSVFKILWNIFLVGFQNMEKSSPEENDPKAKEERQAVRSALQILRTVYVKRPDFLEDKLDSFNVILNSFLKNNNPDWIFVKEISLILERTNASAQSINPIIKNLILLTVKWHGTDNTEWYCSTEQLINMIFTIKASPESLIQYLILQCTKFMLEEGGNINYPKSPGNSQGLHDRSGRIEEEIGNVSIVEQNEGNFEEKVSQLLFIVGHCSVRFLLHFDQIESYFKNKKAEAETKSSANQRGNSSENELDKISGGVEADIERKIDQMHKIGEKYLVQKNLLSHYVPMMKALVNEIINRKASVRNPVVERACILSLCKYMIVSSDFCEKNLNLLFALLKCKIDPVTKTNIIISIGDLIHRFPNVTEPYTSNLYQNLQDENTNVRKTTLMVITHLILNDMLKLKGEVSDIALLFEDPDIKIQNLVKLFFHELHKKDSKIIYNLLPEAIGRLSRLPNVSESDFQTFARNIMQYLEKEKYSETLVDKLCARLKNSDVPKDWRNSAFCMSLLSFNEKGIRRLMDNFELYREKLVDATVNECFKSILTKLKKIPKAETKALIDEWENKLTNFMKEGFEHKRKVPEAKDTKKKKKGGRARENTEMEEEKDDVEEEDNSNKRVLRKLRQPPAQVQSQPRVTRSNKRPKETDQEMSVEEDEGDAMSEEEFMA